MSFRIDNCVRNKSKHSYKRCAFTGYRPQKMPWGFNEEASACRAFKARLKEQIEQLIGEGYAHFISGGAMGMDTWAAEAVLELKERYPWILLEMVSPFDGQASRWDAGYQQRHDRLYELADITTATGHAYTKGCMFRRNRYLVDNSDVLLAAYDGQAGGTAMTCEYARQNGVQVMELPPLEIE